MSRVAERLVQAASPEVVPINGAQAAVLRDSDEQLRERDGRGGSEERGKQASVKKSSRVALFL